MNVITIIDTQGDKHTWKDAAVLGIRDGWLWIEQVTATAPVSDGDTFLGVENTYENFGVALSDIATLMTEDVEDDDVEHIEFENSQLMFALEASGAL